MLYLIVLLLQPVCKVGFIPNKISILNFYSVISANNSRGAKSNNVTRFELSLQKYSKFEC